MNKTGEREPIGDGPKGSALRSAEELQAENVYLKVLLALRDKQINDLNDVVKMKNAEIEKIADKVYLIMTNEFEPYIYGDIAKAIRDKLVESGTPAKKK